MASSSRLLEGLELRPARHGLPLAPLVSLECEAPAHLPGLFSPGIDRIETAEKSRENRASAAEIALNLKQIVAIMDNFAAMQHCAV
jgi:hypothetical protein